jgi:drug/metabolite transporter (DMT)-like permease
MVAAGVSDYLYKRAQTRGVQPMAFFAVQSLFYNACVFAMAAYFGVQLNLATVLYGIAAAYTGFPGMLLLLYSLRHGDATINVPIYRLSFVLTAVGAMLLLGEPARPGKLVAIVLAAGSVLLLSNIRLLAKGIPIGGMGALLAGTALYGIFGLIYKSAMLAGVTPASLMVIQAPLVFLTAFVAAVLGGAKKPDGAILKNAPWCGILLSTSMFLLLVSLQWGEASVNVPIVQLSFVFTSALAVVLLGEKLTRAKVLGILTAALAVIVFAL